MQKLHLTDIHKSYRSAETVHALKGVSLEFRESEFVSILGPSGCGKTTLLNIIGGLDRYDSGGITLGGLSTKDFTDADWDAYRNRCIGFVFQSYNLISHQTVLENVEIALTLSGVSASERRRRAKEALNSVGLSDQLKKKPNQLSGGQMQRVAIARALVNNPEIILADEPTGAIDSQTSIQVMEILKEISKTRLVIMVTHNSELANEYSDRIISLLDGELQSDSNPLFKNREKQIPERKAATADKKDLKKTSMSMSTAATLSFRNLLTKKGRAIITSIAGSIGIIGVALVLALSMGLTDYLTGMQEESLSSFPISITETPQEIRRGAGGGGGSMQLLVQTDSPGIFPDDTVIRRYDSGAEVITHTNVLTPEFFDFVAEMQATMPDAVSNISFARGLEMNVLARGENTVVKYDTLEQATSNVAEEFFGDKLFWQEMFFDEELTMQMFDLLGEGSRLPREKNEVMIIIDDYNRLDAAFFEKLGIFSGTDYFDMADFIGRTILTVIPNDYYYTRTADGLFVPPSVSEYDALYESGNGIDLTIVGIGRKNENSTSLINLTGLAYTTALTDYMVSNAYNSEIARAQRDSAMDVITSTPFSSEDDRIARLRQFGADTSPISVNVYSRDYEGKEQVKRAFDAYNMGRPFAEQIVYNDVAEMVRNMFTATIDTVTIALTGFAAISLIVSTLMIGIITYVSVLERTKEIGILRAVGARKKDISRVFNAEVSLIGLVAGLIGVVSAFVFTIPMNMIVNRMTGLPGVAYLSIPVAVLLVVGSMVLTLIAGFIPSRMAAKKDPVVALRTE